MTLSTDQQERADIMAATQIQVETVRHANMLEFETQRADMENKRSKLELIRLAKEVLIENKRSAPADERGVTAQEITEFADTLASYVDA
jgi:hypothetical protein